MRDKKVKFPFEEKRKGRYWGIDELCEFLPSIRTPIYSAASVSAVDPSISYRKLNYWESSGLISPNRKTSESGWRKFTFKELVELRIISKLKGFGIGTESIIELLELFNSTVEFKNEVTNYSSLEMNILMGLAGDDIGFVLNEDGDVTIDNVSSIIDYLIGERKDFNYHRKVAMQSTQSFLLIYFSDILADILSKLGKQFQPDRKSFYPIFNPKLIMVVQAIEESQYDELVITKTTGDVYKIKQRTRSTGKYDENRVLSELNSGDFQKIELHRGKESLTIVREETVRTD